MWPHVLRVTRMIDNITNQIGKASSLLILISVLVSSGNALVRYIFSNSSNAWLEIQWYLFAAVFLLGAGYTLMRNEHVRIDIVTGGYSQKFQAWLDIVGTLLFLLPMSLTIMILSVPMVLESIKQSEMSSNAGGLLVWPVKLLIPIGFGLLSIQALNEIVKRMAFLAGQIVDRFDRQSHAAQEELPSLGLPSSNPDKSPVP